MAQHVAREPLRFAFGANWRSFVGQLSDARIAEATRALAALVGPDAIRGQSFLDVGSGSGVSSLAAVSLGAARVHSFDFDEESVQSTLNVKRRYHPEAVHWTIERGSVLDASYVAALGQWDVVYSWGVLHHTGAMWTAFRNLVAAVRPGGRLVVALYNDQGWRSRAWWRVKALYNRSALGRLTVIGVGVPVFCIGAFAADLLRARNPFSRYRSLRRGMSPWHDWLDWLGGYPFEVTSPAATVAVARQHGFALERLQDVGGRLGCNEFVFRREC